jgi:hypothetical protein
MDENPNDDSKQKHKRSGKSIRSVVNNQKENTIFVEKYSLNNKSIPKNTDNEIIKYTLNKSKRLFNKINFKKINSRSNSGIPIKLAHSTSKSNLSQSSNLKLSQMKGRKFDASGTFRVSKKFIFNTSLNFKNLSNNNISNNNNSKLKLQSNSNVNNFDIDVKNNNNENKFQRENSHIFYNDNYNNKEIQLDRYSIDKSAFHEPENRTNNSGFLKTIIKTNSIRRSTTPVPARNNIFSINKINETKENYLKKSIVKLNSNYGLSFRSKLSNEKFDYFKNDDFYYNNKFHAG